MADTGGKAPACNDKCGCPSPCVGDNTCKCVEHKQCSCGSHCGCNPCSCSKGVETSGTGKANCKCASGCSCTACGA